MAPSVLVTWRDPDTRDDWFSIEDVAQIVFSASSSTRSMFGYLVYESDDYIVVAGDARIQGRGVAYGRLQRIPRDRIQTLQHQLR